MSCGYLYGLLQCSKINLRYFFWPCMTERNIGAKVADLQFINPVPTPLLVMIRIFSRAHSVITIFPLQTANIMSFPMNAFRYLDIFSRNVPDFRIFCHRPNSPTLCLLQSTQNALLPDLVGQILKRGF